jgi:hypothetical protein
MPLTGEMQVFGVAGGPGSEGSGGSGSPPPAGGSTLPAVKQKIRLGASPLRVVKNKRTTLTATINGGSSCGARLALFQVKRKDWDDLGKAVRPGKKCKATKSVKISSKSRFRAVLIDASSKKKLAQSPTVTVNLK